jgi:hypothetical protein
MNPIIIIGAPRSGTSFLSRLVWKYGNDAKSDMLSIKDARPEVSSYIQTYFQDYLSNSGKRYLVEKTPSNALRLDFVHQVFPEAKFVHILRNGKNSALSIRQFWQGSSSGFQHIDPKRLGMRMKEIRLRQIPHYSREFWRRCLGSIMTSSSGKPMGVWGPRLPGLEEMVRDLDLLEVACLQWRFCVEQACYVGRRLPSSQYLEVRLEDFDQEMMHRVLDFTELPNDPAVDQKIKEHFEPGTSGRRVSTMKPDEDLILEKWLRPTLDWLGYE